MTQNNTEQYVHLSTEYEYDGEQVKKIPFTEITDLGGSVLVECPDGSDRMFSKREIVSIDSS